MNLSSPFLNPHTFVISTVSGGRVGWFNYAFYEKHLHVVWARFLFYEVAFCFYFQEMATIAVLLLILLELLWLLSCLFQADKCCTSLRRFFYHFFYPCHIPLCLSQQFWDGVKEEDQTHTWCSNAACYGLMEYIMIYLSFFSSFE